MNTLANPDCLVPIRSDAGVLWRYRDAVPLDRMCDPKFFSTVAGALQDGDLILIESGSGYVLVRVDAGGDAIRLAEPTILSRGIERAEIAGRMPESSRLDYAQLAVRAALRFLMVAIDTLGPSQEMLPVHYAFGAATRALSDLRKAAS